MRNSDPKQILVHEDEIKWLLELMQYRLETCPYAIPARYARHALELLDKLKAINDTAYLRRTMEYWTKAKTWQGGGVFRGHNLNLGFEDGGDESSSSEEKK